MKATRGLLATLVEDRFGVVPDEVARLIAAGCGTETYKQLCRSVYKVKDLQELLEIMLATLPGRKPGS